MSKFRQSLLFIAAMGMLISACATGARVSGPVAHKPQLRLPDTEFYQIGDPSLPSARKFAKDRADAFRAISDDESNLRSATTATTYGALLSALGLSLTGGGSTDLFAILGLSSAGARGADVLYTSRDRQVMLEDGTGAIRCLLASTEPYLIYESEGQELFGAGFGGGYGSRSGSAGGAIGPITKRELARLLAASEAAGALSAVERADILGRATVASGDVNLRAILTASNAASVLRPTARDDILRRARRSLGALSDDGLDEQLITALLEAEDAKALLDQAVAALASGASSDAANAALADAISAISSGQSALEGLSTFKQGVRKAGPQLNRHVEDVISALRIEIVKAEPNTEAATAAFKEAKNSLAGFFANVKVDEATMSALGGLTAGQTGTGTGAGAATASAAPAKTVDEEIMRKILPRLDNLNAALKTLRDRTARAQRILRDFESSKTASGSLSETDEIANCPIPTAKDTLVISPSARQLKLAPGGKQTLTIRAKSEPVVTETKDTSNVLDVSKPKETPTGSGRYEVTLTAADKVAKVSSAEVEIELEGPGLKRIKTITISAGTATPPAASLTVTPTEKTIELKRGDPPKTLEAKTGDGKAPKIVIGDNVKDEKFLTTSVDEKAGADNTFIIKLGVKGNTPANKETYDIKITTDDGRTAVERTIKVTGPLLPDFKATKPNAFEKIKKLVLIVQKFLNSKDIKPADAAPLTLTGNMDEASRKALWAYQGETDAIGAQDGILDPETWKHIRNKLITTNLEEITKLDNVTPAQIKTAEKALSRAVKENPEFAGKIKADGDLSREERKAIWTLQLSLIRAGKSNAAGIEITGALDKTTYAVLTGSGG